MIILHDKKSFDGVLTPTSENQTCFNMSARKEFIFKKQTQMTFWWKTRYFLTWKPRCLKWKVKIMIQLAWGGAQETAFLISCLHGAWPCLSMKAPWIEGSRTVFPIELSAKMEKANFLCFSTCRDTRHSYK